MFPPGSKRPPRSLPRDPAPHLPNSAAHPFPSPSTAVHPRQASHELNRHVETVRSTPEEECTEEGTLDDNEVSYSDRTRELLKEGKARRSRVAHKERGSLRRASRDDDLSFRNRHRDAPAKVITQNLKPKSKPRALRKTKVEVFIPSIVSVGNLSRILRVSLGTSAFSQKTPRIHCLEQVDFSGRCGKPEWQRKLPMIMVILSVLPVPSQL
jgi:translation initiation factor IF-2